MTPPKHQFNIKWSDISKKGELYIEFRPVPFRYLVGGVMTPPYTRLSNSAINTNLEIHPKEGNHI